MDFPPLDDTRWDRLLRAVIGQRPTVGDPDAPLSASFPVPSAWRELARELDERRQHAGDTIDLDAYA